MNNLFLPLIYKDIKIFSTLSTKDLVNIGWKCRKWQNWSAIHAEQDDRMVLRTFGDSAVENQIVESDLLERVYSIFLNVARWRLDKQSLSIDPPKTESWAFANNMLNATLKEPRIAQKYLHETLGLQIDNTSLSDYSSLILQSLIFPIFDEALGGELTRYRLSEVEETLKHHLKLTFDEDELPYEYMKACEFGSISSLASQLGLPSLDKVVFEKLEQEEIAEADEITVDLEKLPISELFVREQGPGFLAIHLNSNNHFIAEISKCPKSMEKFSKFFISYSKCISKIPPSKQAIIQKHLSYLALELDELGD